MKTKLFMILIGLVVLTISITSFAQGNGSNGNRANRGNNSQISDMINNMPVENLTENEIASLLKMREEEKLARDIYLELFDKWTLRIFSNIASSEQQHTDMVALILKKYDIDDLFVEERGVFENEELTKLYALLVEQGKESLLAGLIVGATIEDLDIYDLQEALVYIDNQDIRLVYQNLLKGSRNHMRSFYGQITAQGGSYEAQYITMEELEKIINSEMERGLVDSDGNATATGSRKGSGKGNRRNGKGGQSFFGNAGKAAGIKVSNYPNPANPTTIINYAIEKPANVSLSIYNVTGQAVRHFDFGYHNAGEYSHQWDALNENGINVPSGVYFYRIQAGELSVTQRLMLVQ